MSRVEMTTDMWDLRNSLILFFLKALYSQVPSLWEIKCTNSDVFSYTSPSVLWFSRMYCKTLNHGCTAWFSRGWRSIVAVVLHYKCSVKNTLWIKQWRQLSLKVRWGDIISLINHFIALYFALYECKIITTCRSRDPSE